MKYVERIMTLEVEKTVQRSFLHLLSQFYKECLTKKSCQPHGPFLVKSVIADLVEIFELEKLPLQLQVKCAQMILIASNRAIVIDKELKSRLEKAAL